MALPGEPHRRQPVRGRRRRGRGGGHPGPGGHRLRRAPGRGRRPAGRPGRPGHGRPGALGGHRGRDHRLQRQDHHQGPARRRPGHPPGHRGQPGVVQQRGRPAPDPGPDRARRPRRWWSRWAPAAPATSPPWPAWPGRRSASSSTSASPTWACSAPGRRSPRPRASWSSPCRPTARPSSTPTTPRWRPWPTAPWPGWSASVSGPAAEVRAEEVTLDGDGRASFTLVTPAGTAQVDPAGPRRAPGLLRPGRGRGRPRPRGRAGRGRRRAGHGHPLAHAHAGPAPARRADGGQRRLQRQPVVDGRRPQDPGRPRPPGRAHGRRARRDGRAGPGRGRPSTTASAGWPPASASTGWSGWGSRAG